MVKARVRAQDARGCAGGESPLHIGNGMWLAAVGGAGGSLLSAIFNRIACRVILLVLFLMEIQPSHRMYIYRPWFLVGLLMVGLEGMVLFTNPARKRCGLVTQKHYLSPRQRLVVLQRSGPLAITFGLCLVLMVIEVVF